MITACEQMSAAYERGRMSRDAEVAQLVTALKALCAWGDEREEQKYPEAFKPWLAARAAINAWEGK